MYVCIYIYIYIYITLVMNDSKCLAMPANENESRTPNDAKRNIQTLIFTFKTTLIQSKSLQCCK